MPRSSVMIYWKADATTKEDLIDVAQIERGSDDMPSGAHTTAYVVFRSQVERILLGKNFKNACTGLQSLFSNLVDNETMGLVEKETPATKRMIEAYKRASDLVESDPDDVREKYHTQYIQRLALDYLLVRNNMSEAVLSNVSGRKELGEVSEQKALDEIGKARRDSSLSAYVKALVKFFDDQAVQAGIKDKNVKTKLFIQHVADIIVAFPPPLPGPDVTKLVDELCLLQMTSVDASNLRKPLTARISSLVQSNLLT